MIISTRDVEMNTCGFFLLVLIESAWITNCEKFDLSFPPNFKVGAAVAAYQVEGGWNADGKGENVWDHFTHTQPWSIADRSNGDIACDSYHKYKEDVYWIKQLHLDHYRFSFSWSRILPTGFLDKINIAGLRYYHNLIDELLANGIEPIATLYHWDHPQVLEKMGGWMNEMMVQWFSDYARLIFQEFGHKVKIFSTINEPLLFCGSGYAGSSKAPGKAIYGGSKWICGHNVLKAHATVYHIYDDEFRPTCGGQIGIVLPCDGYIAKYSNDNESVDTAFQFNCGWIAHPLYKGDYPEILKKRIAENSKRNGFPRSMLPTFSESWILYIKGTSDYLGLNHYTTRLVEKRELTAVDTFTDPLGLSFSVDPSWSVGASHWLYMVPQGLGDLLRRINREYDNPTVYIMENGISDPGVHEDYQRMEYLYSYMREVLIAIKRDGCDVRKYTIWSCLDNFEWEAGYAEHFGLIAVNFSSPNRERRPKLSTAWLKESMCQRRLVPIMEPPRRYYNHN